MSLGKVTFRGGRGQRNPDDFQATTFVSTTNRRVRLGLRIGAFVRGVPEVAAAGWAAAAGRAAAVAGWAGREAVAAGGSATAAAAAAAAAAEG